MNERTLQLALACLTFLIFTLGMTWMLTRFQTQMSSLSKIPVIQTRSGE